jgi:RNA polymerase sigma-70 factor (ECF subfamily)
MISAQSQTREGRAAFAELYQLYRYPLYTFARRGGHSPEDAQELKGKFRSFLLASFQNYLSVDARRGRRVKRGGK